MTDLDGYWKADTDTFYLYLNEDYSDDPTTFAFDWYNTENGEYIQLDDIVLSSEGDGSNLETTLDQMMTTASVIEYVAQGTYWIGSGDETAMIFYLKMIRHILTFSTMITARSRHSLFPAYGVLIMTI